MPNSPNSSTSPTHLFPRLVVADADTAISFYVTALGGQERARFTDPSGRVVNAEVLVGTNVFSITESDGSGALAPTDAEGSTVLFSIGVDDADACADAMVSAGATVVIPVDDRFYGRREGRLRDPAGHLWIVSQEVEQLSDEEVRSRLSDL